MARKINRTVILIIVLCIVAVAALVLTRPAPEQPPSETVVAGVAPGDIFTYIIKGMATIIDSNATIPENFFQLNMTEWYRVTITNVTDEIVSFNSTWRFSNGTGIDKPGKVNIKTGIGNSQDFWAIYASGLKAGDYARPLGTDKLAINATENRIYKSGGRETNKASLETQFYDMDDPTLSRTYNDYLSIYFDKQTGMLVELTDVKYYSSPELILTLEWKILDSTAWDVS
jgi:hypothetical protein